MFHSFDKDGDDEIDLTEVCEAMGIDIQEARTHISVNDKDGNGTISFNEFFLLIRSEQKKIEIRRKKSDERWRSAFMKYDKDKSKSIEKEEFKMFWRDIEHNLTEQAIDLMFATCDLDADGKIGYEEFAAMLSFVSE